MNENDDRSGPPAGFDDLPPIEAYDGAPWGGGDEGEGWENASFEGGFAGAGASHLVEIDQVPPTVSDRLPEDVLKDVFGYDTFRSTQHEVITSLLGLNDTLAVMPTGGGKSLCFQLPALLFDGLTVVVSPLISLMQDQVRQLHAVGVEAVLLNSTLDSATYRRNRRSVADGTAKLLYLAPETLFQERTRALLRSVRVSCLTIDEAHCISEWGHDFRPEYRRLASIREDFPKAVCIALTATATPRVRDDIARILGLADNARFVASFDRPNLMFRAQEKDDAMGQLLAFIERVEGKSGIVYCGTRKAVDKITKFLSTKGLRALPYHAGLGAEVRRTNQEKFIRDDVDVIVATVAFGMGIDKPDVRFVVHFDMPKSLEAYYQEVGRAGRDSLPAECLLLHASADLRTIEFHISQKSDAEQRVARLQLGRMMAFAETTKCRRKPLLEYFGQASEQAECQACDNCIEPPPDAEDLTIAAQKFLSCVFRTGQRFGTSHIVEVLRGSQAQKVVRFGHNKVSTHGIGREYDPAQWKHLARQFIQQGLVVQDPGHGGLSLSDDAWPLLRGNATFEGRLRLPAAQAKKKKRKQRAPEGPTDYDFELFEHLRAERKKLADAKGVPPYVVFSDRSLREMAAKLPKSEAEFGSIHGVGQKKLQVYGAQFVGLVTDWCEVHGG